VSTQDCRDRFACALERHEPRFPHVDSRRFEEHARTDVIGAADIAERDAERSGVLPQALEKLFARADRRVRFHGERNGLAVQLRERRHVRVIQRMDARQAVRHDVRQRHREVMRVTRMLIQINPGERVVRPGPVHDRYRRCNPLPIGRDLLQQTRGQIERAARRHADHDFDRTLGLPLRTRPTGDADPAEQRDHERDAAAGRSEHEWFSEMQEGEFDHSTC
jgi:hypothetical protein